MATRQMKLEKHRRRRQEKQRQVRVAQNHRIQDFLSDHHEVYACYVNADWRSAGMASILLGRRIGQGMVSFAAFLVDNWGMGLKDAWGKSAVSQSDFEETVECMRARAAVKHIELSLVRHLVFGGIEVARKLGFRLPKNHEHWTRLIGPLPPREKPDMSLFGKDGKTHIWCSDRDLELRYLGDPKKLLNRPDIEFVIGANDFTLWDDEAEDADDEDDDLESQVMDGSLVATVHDWCAREGIATSPILEPLVNAMRVSSEDVLDDILSLAGPDGDVVMPTVTPDMLINRTMTQMRIMGYDEREVAVGFTQIFAAMQNTHER